MKILIGTVNLNNKILTDLFIESVCDAASFCHSEHKIDIVVVDNGSSDDSISYIKSKGYLDYINFIENKTNIGVAGAWNQIIKYGFKDDQPLYDYYFICNNDIYWTKYSITNFIQSVKSQTEFGCISFMANDYKEPSVKIPEIQQIENQYWSIRPNPDNIQTKEQIKDILDIVYHTWGGIEEFTEELKKYGNKLREIHPKAFCFALTKECIKQVGLFDEYNSPVGLHEDVDYHERIRRFSKLKIGMVPNAYVHHMSMMTRTKSNFKNDWVEKREQAFKEKWTVSSKDLHTLQDIKFKLDIGAGYGPKIEPGWMHLDTDNQFNHIEYLHDCSKTLPFGDNTIDEIYSSNCLEHQEWKKVQDILKDWIRCLKPNGKIEIRVPNFEFAVYRYIEKSWGLRYDTGELNIMHLLMGGDHEGVAHIHKSLFDFDNLSLLMNNAGLKNIKNISQSGSWELRMTGIKK